MDAKVVMVRGSSTLQPGDCFTDENGIDVFVRVAQTAGMAVYKHSEETAQGKLYGVSLISGLVCAFNATELLYPLEPNGVENADGGKGKPTMAFRTK